MIPFSKYLESSLPIAPSQAVGDPVVVFCYNVSLSTIMPTASKRASSVESFKVMDVLRRANELSLTFDVLHCEIGQPQTGAPKAVAHAAQDALSHHHTMGYTDAFGLLELREKIAAHYVNYYPNLASAPSTDQIVVTTGSSGAFLLAFTACFDRGDTIAIASSGYPCYRNILSALGCRLCNIPISSEFKLTAKELREEIGRRKSMKLDALKGLILSSPSNPTGAMLTPFELQELCRACDDNDIQFLSDEIYHGISYGKEEATALQYSANAVCINSFSKYYSSKFHKMNATNESLSLHTDSNSSSVRMAAGLDDYSTLSRRRREFIAAKHVH